MAVGLPHILEQDVYWCTGKALDDMDRHHRANLIPFLRRNAVVLHDAFHDLPEGSTEPTVAEEWLEAMPLMRRLTAMEAGRPLEERRATHERNQAHEAETGYRKITLVDPREIERRRHEFEDAFGDDRWWEP
jgi:hypothetical protein